MKERRIIAALQDSDLGIGIGTDLLFRISDDLKRFKTLTTGQTIIMGRKTFDSIGAKPLPNRGNIVITKDVGFKAEGVIVVHSIEEAFEIGEKMPGEFVYVIGGGEIYRQTLPLVDSLFLTIIESEKVANVFFPAYGEIFKNVTSVEEHYDETTGLDYLFIVLKK